MFYLIILVDFFFCFLGHPGVALSGTRCGNGPSLPLSPPAGMEDAGVQRGIWDGDAKTVQQCLTDIFTSVYTTCDIPENAIFGPCVLSHTSLYDSIAFIALKSTDKRTVPYIFRVRAAGARTRSAGRAGPGSPRRREAVPEGRAAAVAEGRAAPLLLLLPGPALSVGVSFGPVD